MCIFLFLIFTVNCEWKDWTSWESCSVTCGNGTQKRTRTPYIAAKYGGVECGGIWHNENDYEYKDCCNDDQIYNPLSEECCDDGSVALTGTCA